MSKVVDRSFKLLLTLAFLIDLPVEAADQGKFIPLDLLNRVQEIVSTASESETNSQKLCFPSAESSFDLGVVTNCVKIYGSANFRFWLMSQDIAPMSSNGLPNSTMDTSHIHNLIGTLVSTDKSNQLQAYYLEFERDTFEMEGLLKPVDYKVPCVMCHPSGPRLIRPSRKFMDGMTATESETLKILAHQEIEWVI